MVRTGDARARIGWGGGLRIGGGWRSIFLEPSFALTGAIWQSGATTFDQMMGGGPNAGPMTGATGEAPGARTYALRLSGDVALFSVARVALHTGPSFALETTDWSTPGGFSPTTGSPALRPGWEARLLVALAPSVQAFVGVNGDCRLNDFPAGMSPRQSPAVQPQPSGDRCGAAAEVGVALTLLGAPAARVR
jgi:hypothetical protein